MTVQVESIATLTLGRACFAEFKVLVESLNRIEAKQPIFVGCDLETLPDVKEALGGLNHHIIPITDHDLELMRERFRVPSRGRWLNEVMAFKQIMMLKALESASNVLFLDADCCVLAPVNELILKSPGEAIFRRHRPGQVRHGCWQGGVAWTASRRFVEDWIEAFYLDDGFADQSVLQSNASLHSRIGEFNLGVNVGPWVLNKPDQCWSKYHGNEEWIPDSYRWPSAAQFVCNENWLSIRGGIICYRGHPIQVAHFHPVPSQTLKVPFSWRYNEDFRWAMLWLMEKSGIQFSMDPV